MSATMNDDLGVPFTIIKPANQESANAENQYHCQIPHDNYFGSYIFEMDNLNLHQYPTETLTMQIAIKNENSYFKSQIEGRSVIHVHRYSYIVELRFDNYLHEFDQSYSYEIICKIIKSKEHLFSFSVKRDSGYIQSDRQVVDIPDGVNLSTDLYFGIRRHSSGSNEVRADNEQIQQTVATLRSIGCDVALEAKDGVIHTHKSILSQNSEVFKAMLSADMKEKQSGNINVADFEVRVVNKMLDFLYTGQLGELGDMTESLFKLAHCYQLHELCRRCEEHYIFNLNTDIDHITDILNFARVYELKKLNECTMNFINHHLDELSALPSFLKFLSQDISLENTVIILLVIKKPGMEDLKMKVFDFINDHYHRLMENSDFVSLFDSAPGVMKELHVYMHQQKL